MKIICKDIKNNDHEVDLLKLKFRPSVYGILIEGNKILLSKQWDGYDFPGGGMDVDETIEETLKREFFEETGIKVMPGKLITVRQNFFKPPFDKGYWNSIMMYYVVKKIGGEISTDNFDKHEKEYVEMPEWIDIIKTSDIKFYNTEDSVKIIMEAKKYI